MTSPSKQTEIEQQLNAQLNKANANLPQKVQQDITGARRKAVAMAAQSARGRFFTWRIPLPTTYVSIGVALAVVALVSYQPDPSIPVLPANLLVEDVPSEDLALLEDLDFANWLLEQQEGLL